MLCCAAVLEVFYWRFFAGALADKYGCKRFLLIPVIGKVVSDIGMIINYTFIEQLPTEFFFIEPVDAFFGGASVYYLGKLMFFDNYFSLFI